MTEAGPIGDSDLRSVLIVADRTVATPALLAAVSRGTSEGARRFTGLVPLAFWDTDTEEAITHELAIPSLEEPAGVGWRASLAARTHSRPISAAPGSPSGTTRSWSRRSRHTSPTGCTLISPRRVRRLGLPVTVVTARKAAGPSGAPAGRATGPA